MKKIHTGSIPIVCVLNCCLLTPTRAHAFWGIPEATLITTCSVTGCFCYQHKRTDTVRQRIKELDDAQKRITTELQTLANNGSSLSNNVSALSSVMLTNQREQRDLQSAYDGHARVISHRPPPQLPGAVPEPEAPPFTVSRMQTNHR